MTAAHSVGEDLIKRWLQMQLKKKNFIEKWDMSKNQQ